MIKLSHPYNLPQCKRYWLTQEGVLKSSRVKMSAWWQAQELELNTLEELLQTLLTLQEQPHAYLVAGALTEHGRAEVERHKKIRRLSRGDEKNLPTIWDKPSTILTVDIDNASWVGEPGQQIEASIQAAIHSHLPQPFHHADFLYQLSASCLIKDPQKLKVHLFFELDTPRGLRELKELALESWPRDEHGKLLIDPALFTVGQPIYTARPLLQAPLTDPLPHTARTQLVKRAGRVMLPKITRPQTPTAQKPTHRLLKGQLQLLTRPTSHQKEDTGARAALSKKVEQLACTLTLRHEALLKAAFWLGRFVGAARLSAHEVVERLREACLLNGYVSAVGEREIERVTRDGLNAGSQQPLYDERLFEPIKRVRFVEEPQNKAPSSPQALLAQLEGRSPHLTPPPALPASSPQEIEAEVRRALAQAFASGQALRLVKLPTGAGKTHLALKLLAQEVQRGRSVLYLTPNHLLLKEAAEKLKQLSTIEPLILEGRLQACELYQRHEELRPIIDELREEGLSIPQLCSELSCPFFATCKARKQRAKHSLEGRFTLAAHAMLSHLKELPKDTLVVIDESPQMVFTKELPVHRLSTLCLTSQDVAELKQGYRNEAAQWRAQHQHTVGRFIEALLPLIKELHINNLKRSRGYAIDLDHKALQRHLSSLKPLAEQVLNSEITLPSLQLKRGELSKALIQERQDIALNKRVLHSSTIKLAQELALLISGQEVPLWLVSSPHGQLSFERRAPLELPQEVQVCALDATPHLPSWEALAQRSLRTLKVYEGDSSKLTPHVTKATWLSSKAYRTSRLFTETGELSIEDTTWALNTLARQLKRSFSTLSAQATVGVGTHKPLAEALERALKGEGPEWLLQHELIKELSRFKEVVVGYSGRDNVASNRFERCEGLVIIGAPKRELRSTLADLKALNPELPLPKLQASYSEWTQAALAQWVGRLRTLRRQGCVLLYAGDEAPPEAPNMSWEELEAEEGRPRDEQTVSVELWAREALSKGLTITRKLLVQMGASLKASRGIIARLRALEGTRAAWLAHGEIALSQPIGAPMDKLIAELKRWVEGSVKRLQFRAPQLGIKALCAELKQGVVEQPTLRWLPAWWGSPLLEALWPRPPPS